MRWNWKSIGAFLAVWTLLVASCLFVASERAEGQTANLTSIMLSSYIKPGTLVSASPLSSAYALILGGQDGTTWHALQTDLAGNVKTSNAGIPVTSATTCPSQAFSAGISASAGGQATLYTLTAPCNATAQYLQVNFYDCYALTGTTAGATLQLSVQSSGWVFFSTVVGTLAAGNNISSGVGPTIPLSQANGGSGRIVAMNVFTGGASAGTIQCTIFATEM